MILLTARLDFETTQRYTLTIIARDGGGEETAGRARINVLDVNDNVPTFQKEAYLGALRENEPSVTQVVRLRVRDEQGRGPHPPSLLAGPGAAPVLTPCLPSRLGVRRGLASQQPDHLQHRAGVRLPRVFRHHGVGRVRR